MIKKVLLTIFFISSLFGIEVFEDKDSKYSFEQIRNEDVKFQNVNKHQLSKSFSWATYWIKINLQNDTNKDKNFYILFDLSNMSLLESYSFENNKLKIQKNGSSIPIDKKELKIKESAFEYTLSPNSSQTIYIKVKADYLINLNYEIYDYQEFILKLKKEERLDMVIIGALMALFIYNLFLFSSIREISYGYYLGYLLGIIGFWCYATNMQILSINQSLLNHISFSFTTIFSLLFLWRLLIFNPSNWLRFLFMAVLIQVSLLTFFGLFYPNEAIWISTKYQIHLFVIVMILTIIIYSIKNRNPLGKYILLGWSFFILGSIVTNLALVGSIEDEIFNRGLFFGSLAEALIFSLVLSYRFRVETEVAQINSFVFCLLYLFMFNM